MIVPYEELSSETLNNLIESIVLREGTDYGEHELSLQEKVNLVKLQLEEGTAAIEYSQEHDSVNIITINKKLKL